MSLQENIEEMSEKDLTSNDIEKVRYADVVIDRSHEALDRIFEYRLPPSLSGMVDAGSRVLVPFGAGNRETAGYVVHVKDRPTWNPDKMKDILGVEEGSIPVEGQLIRLASFIRNQYGSTMIQALRTVMPVRSKVRPKSEIHVELAIDHKEALDLLADYDRRHAVRKAQVLRRLLEKGRMTGPECTGECGLPLSGLRKMESSGIVRIREKILWRNPYEKLEKRAKPVTLNEEQEAALCRFREDYDRGVHPVYLLFGITGSGKTEVYLEMIRHVQKKGRQAIVLIPEISLTWQTVRRFYDSFGDRIAVLNSKMSKGERYDAGERIRRGEADVVIGPRSALFAPVRDLGLILIDEEHDHAFKSDLSPKYHASMVARYRAKLAGASLVLGSATPLIESYERALRGEYQLLKLNKRAGQAALPRVHIVDLREELRKGNRSVFSQELRRMILDRIEKKEQIMLFINRRGFAGFVSCRNCGEVISCPHCDVSLTYHRDHMLRCHYCGYERPHVEICPSCGSAHVASFGIGTEKVEDAIREEFPQARVLRMDTDTTRKKNAHEEILKAFSEGKADILLGTQMIVKGHDYANVTLVGILAADLSLFDRDFRSGERTFQLLCQAAGRAGRGGKKGEVLIQTYRPDHYAIRSAADHSYYEFYENESVYRKMMLYPPYGHMMAILILAERKDQAFLAHDRIRRMLEISQEKEDDPVRIMDPGPAMISKMRDEFRYVLYLKHRDTGRLTDLRKRLENVVETHDLFSGIRVQYDLDPMNVY